MEGYKSFFTSKTIWGVVITGIGALLAKFGFNFGVDPMLASDMVNFIVGSMPEVLEFGGMVLALYGRIKATKAIS